MFGYPLFALTSGGGGGGGVTYPAMTLTSPSFDTSTPIVGAASLNGGSGSVSIVLPSGLTGFTAEGKIRIGATPTMCNIYNITDSSGLANILWINSDRTLSARQVGGSFDTTGTSTTPITAGTHDIAFVWQYYQDTAGDYRILHVAVDGAAPFFHAVGAGANPTAGAATFTIQANSTVVQDSIRTSSIARYGQSPYTPPTGAYSRDAYTLSLHQFDLSDGTGS